MKRTIFAGLLLLLSIASGRAQLPEEGFEGTWTTNGPAGWTIRNEAGPVYTWALNPSNNALLPGHESLNAAYLQRENVISTDPVPSDWLITPYFQIPENAQLRFFSRLTFQGDQGGVYKILISTDADPQNWAAYQELQVWSELSLNPMQTEYLEKKVDIPSSYVGAAHIAFVMQGDDRDRWLVDDVSVVSKCLAPTGLSAFNITLDTAQLAWNSPSGATQCELSLLSPSQVFNGSGTEYSGLLPFLASGLSQNTVYRYYVRSLCSEGSESDWEGPFSFETFREGDNCTYPKTVSLPYFQNNQDTAGFNNTFDGFPGSNCGGWGNYLAGNDVVYTFTPASDANIKISLSDFTTTTGAFVYASCTDIGSNCITGATSPVGQPLDLLLAASAGTTYYLVLSTYLDANTTPYSISIQPINCAEPTGLQATAVTQGSATLSWNTDSASAWEYAVLPYGSDFPASGQSTTQNSITVFAPTGGGTLMPGSHYEVYLRASCGAGLFSPWAGPYRFTTRQYAAPLDYQQGFSQPVHGWTAVNDTQKNAWQFGTPVTETSAMMYISQDGGTTNTYDPLTASVTFAYRDITMPGALDQLELSFDWHNAGEASDNFRIWMVPATYVPLPGYAILPVNGNVLLTPELKGQPLWAHYQATLQGTPWAGQVQRIVIEWANNSASGQNPAAAIDNFALSVVPCSSPQDLAITAANQTQVTYQWSALTATSPSYDYYFAQSPAPPGSATMPTGNVIGQSVTIGSLTPGTTNYFWVRSNCGGAASLWSGPLTFVTPAAPQALDYTEDFEGSHGWTLSNGAQANKWAVGTATNNGGSHALYISDDGGTAHHYDTNTRSVTHAYKDIFIPATIGELSVNFDWTGVGEYGDVLSVWLVPVWYTPTPGTELLTIDNIGVNITENLKDQAGWIQFSQFVNSSQLAGTSRRLLFQWANNDNWGEQHPGAVDNIAITAITCAAPTALAPAVLSGTTANITWTGPTVITPIYDYYVSNDGTVPSDVTVPTGNVTAQALALPTVPNTSYKVWVRSNCGGSDHSYWVGPVSFMTPQVPGILDYSDDLEGSMDWTFVNNDQNKWVQGTAVSSSPAQSIYISNNDGLDNAYSADQYGVSFAYRDIVVPSGTSQIDLSFDWKGNGSPDHRLRVWVGPATYQPVVNNQIYSQQGITEMAGNFYNQLDWTTANYGIDAQGYAGTTMRVIFEWTSNFWSAMNNPPAAIDNISLAIATCPRPTALNATAITATSATLSWNESGSATQWEVYLSGQGQPAPNAATTGSLVSALPYTIALTPFTSYEYYVRAICAANDKSGWAGPYLINTPIGNDFCPDATMLPVNPGEECLASRPGVFWNASISPEPIGCTGQNGGDIWYQFTATAPAHNISLSHFTGNTAPFVIALYEGDQCGSLIPLDCSFNNYLMANNLVPGTSYRVRVQPNMDFAYQDTVLEVCVTTPTPPANNNAAQCNITTVNADFEDPAHTGDPTYPNFIHHNFVQGWRTTATDAQIEFWPDTNFLGVPAYSGHNFVELNANQASGLYQDYDTPQITEFTYGFAHRGRYGDDTCVLKAGPPEGPFMVIATKTTGTGQWDYVTGSYTTPAGQTVTRFIFESDSAFNGDYSIGNFLDAISFTANNGILSANPLALDCAESATTVVAAGIGQWSAHSDNPSATLIADANANTTSISGFAAFGTYRYDWTTQYCTSVLEITYGNLNIALPGVSDLDYCLGDAPAQLTVTPTGNYTINWYDQATGGMASAIAPTPDTATVGETTYYVSQSSVAGCEGDRAAITVTVHEIPAAPLTQDITYCQGQPAQALTALGATGNSLIWYATATDTAPLGAAPVPQTTTAEVTEYYVSQLPASGCESPRAKITVTVNPIVVNVTGFSLAATLCTKADDPLPSLAEGFTTGGTFTSSPAGLSINAQTGLIDLEASAPGNYSVTYAIAPDTVACNNGGSTSVSIAIVTDIAVVAGFSYAPVYCYGSATATPELDAGFTTGGAFSASGGLAVDAATGIINLADSQPGMYTVTYTVAPDAAACNPGGSYSETLTIAGDLDFTLIGDCRESHFVISVEGGVPDAGNITHQWTIADGSQTGVTGEEFDVTTYLAGTPATEFPLEIQLTVSSNGCQVTRSYIVDDIFCAIQRGISPNGDGLNDYFDLVGMGAMKLSIFNRYGQQVYTRSPYEKEWHGQGDNGDSLPTGTYFYMIELSGESKTGWIYINREE